MKILLSSLSLVLLIGCAAQKPMQQAEEAPLVMAHADINPTGKKGPTGRVEFIQEGSQVRVQASISGLKEGLHGFHIHEKGDCGDGGKAAGGHYNPMGHDHSGPDEAMRHMGDMGNLKANAKGYAILNMLLDGVELTGENSIRGRGLIIHEKADDLKTQPTGDAGGRIGCGIIQ